MTCPTCACFSKTKLPGRLTRKQDSGQQWDGRNSWPPLQWMLIQGLRRSADAEAVTGARKLAAELEEAFLTAALSGWEASGAMMEKYDAKEAGRGGGGGEYNVQ
ncbi:unnamed protein product, partial [Laminaria digitata]